MCATLKRNFHCALFSVRALQIYLRLVFRSLFSIFSDVIRVQILQETYINHQTTTRLTFKIFGEFVWRSTGTDSVFL